MKILNVLYGCDNNYAPYTGVSMTSLFENNRDMDTINVYFAGVDISADNTRKFHTLCEKYDRNIIWLDTKRAMERTKEYRCKGWNGSLATWLRFFVLEQIPDSVENLLWIDSDTLVYGNLLELVSLDLDEYAMAAVGDSICLGGRARTGLKETDTYFNAGVLLFNLEYWRKENTLIALMEHLQKNVDRYKANDQDLLNDFLKYKIFKLDLKYNCQGFLFAYDEDAYLDNLKWKGNAFYTKKEIVEAKEQPCIVHFFRFLGDYPWAIGKQNFHPLKEKYLYWKNMSLWKDDNGVQVKKDLIYRIEKILYILLPKKLFLTIFIRITRES